jgi:MFS family permease
MTAPLRVVRAVVRPPRLFRAFENHHYTQLWLANGLSYTSRWMQMTLLAWLALELTDSPWSVALVGFFSSTPMLLLGLLGGVLADEVHRHRLLVVMQGVSTVTSLVLTLLLGSGVVQVWHVYLTVLLDGASWALSMPARRAMLFDVLGGSGVANAVALDAVGMNVSRMLGPALAGVLITLVGVTGGYATILLFYTTSLLLLGSLAVPDVPRPARHRQSIGRNLLEGFQYVRQHQTLLATIYITVVMNFLLFPYMPMVPVIARDVLRVDALLMGALQAAEGGGALVGALVIASATRIAYHGRIFLGGSLLALGALCAFSMSRWYVLSLPVLLLLGLGAAGFGTMQSTIVLLAAREDMRGRALGVMSLAIGAGPLGSLALGALASAVNPVFALRLNALLGIIALACIALLLPAITDRTQPVRPSQTQRVP